MPKVLNVYSKINKLREKYYSLSIGKEALLSVINEAEIPEQVFNSNAIENSTLTLEETEKILLQIDLDRYASEREIFEAKNLAKIVFLIDQKAKEEEISLSVILSLHKILLTGIRDEIAGRFRKKGEYVKVGSHIGLDPELIEERLKKVIIEYKSNVSESIIKRLAKFHLSLESIHPFIDGNGRIGRVMNNYILIREGYVPISIKLIDRVKYYEAFREFDDKGETKIMEEIIGKALCNSYYKRITYLEGKEVVSLLEYAKRKKLSYPNLLNKAKRQTIEAFLERGSWKIGI
jgi:Fic family protein